MILSLISPSYPHHYNHINRSPNSVAGSSVKMDYFSSAPRCFLVIWILSTASVLLFFTSNITGVFGDNLALLTGTLKTYQKASCDGEYMTLRCPTGTTISISVSQYGKTAPSPALCQSSSNNHPDLVDSITDPYNNITCQLPSAIQTTVSICQKKQQCRFQTSPGTFGGDPCPGSRKYVEVAYKCRPSEFKSVIGCENEVIQLRCNRSSRLAIYSANYGRTEYESVQCPQPNGVSEESCLSSFATETVMQMCHGKRRCALNVDPATFGKPCKPESAMYLKVIYTCIPRKVLKEKYQGEAEPDEMFEDETEYETGDPVGGVLEQPSIYSPDHSKGWVNQKSTSKPSSTPSKSHSSDRSIMEIPTPIESSAVLDIERLEPVSGHTNLNSNNSHDVHIIYLISQGMQAYDFISRNSDRVWLLVTIGIICCLVVILIVIVGKILYQRSTGRRPVGCTNSKPSSSSAGPITSVGGLSDIDELSVVMNDITELPSILRKSSVDELQRGLSTVTSTSSTMTSVSAATAMISPSIPATMTLGRGINRANRESTNIRFYYD